MYPKVQQLIEDAVSHYLPEMRRGVKTAIENTFSQNRRTTSPPAQNADMMAEASVLGTHSRGIDADGSVNGDISEEQVLDSEIHTEVTSNRRSPAFQFS